MSEANSGGVFSSAVRTASTTSDNGSIRASFTCDEVISIAAKAGSRVLELIAAGASAEADPLHETARGLAVAKPAANPGPAVVKSAPKAMPAPAAVKAAAARPGFVVTAAKPSQDPDSLPTRPMHRPGQPRVPPGLVRPQATPQWYMQPWVWGLALGMLGALLVVIAILTS